MKPLLFGALVFIIFSCTGLESGERTDTEQTAPSTTASAGNCPPEGDSRDPRIQQLDRLKNRDSTPAEFADHVTIMDLMASRSPDDFDTRKGAVLEGYILSAKQEKGESCNCHSHDKADLDNHIFLAPGRGTGGIDACVVIEATPATRRLHPEFTLAYFKRLKGKHVRVTGYLMYDFMHTDLIGRSRGTVWELHPVTNVEVLED